MTTKTHAKRGVQTVRIDREFHNPNIVKALQHVDETTLAEILDNSEVLDALKHAQKQADPTRPANEFFDELHKEKIIS